MFNKLVSSLPFNPSLINQVSFYATRLKKEASVRRLGFILVALVFIVQMFAVFSPAQPTLARDGNDIIPGGVQSKDQLVLMCLNNSYDLKTILSHFAISCTNLSANSEVVSLRSTDFNNTLYSMGRKPQGEFNDYTGKATDEIQIAISGLDPLYMRKLSSWDSGGASTYKQVLSVGNAFNVQYFILFSCGNIVSKGKPAPPAPAPTPPPVPAPTPAPKPTPTPAPTKPCPASKNVDDILSCIVISKKARNVTQNISNAHRTTAKAGDVIEYSLIVKNTAKVTANNFVVQENVADILEYSDLTVKNGSALGKNSMLKWPSVDIKAGQTIQKQFRVKVKNPIPQTPSPCPPTSTANQCPLSSSFDLRMTNVYGNTIVIKLPPTIIKTTEIVTTTELPKTGPGTSLMIGFAVTAVAGYYYSRSRLLAKELDIIRKDYASSGGM